jgi:hypothetical protein
MSHPAHVYTTLEHLLRDCVGPRETFFPYQRSYEQVVRYWTRVWNQHIEKHGNVPLIRKCSLCSGAEHKHDIKVGKWKVSTRREPFLLE